MDVTSRHGDPYAAFNFVIDIEGMKAAFSEVEGLPTESDIEDRFSGKNTKARRLPSKSKYANISLKSGYTSKDFWEWGKSAKGVKTRGLSGTISVFDEARKSALVWKFYEAWPQKWEGPAMNAKTSEVAIEELGLSVEGLELISEGDDPNP